ncbi:glutaredoxin family protein [Mesobacillus harenae]|uniref:glutaredoxin family protein n=1 Tax=Mesobacillus harenae TaxID=2213203 RepID=UPI00157FFA62|nr:glutaredoxin family protein [Mesobacillus harenae]
MDKVVVYSQNECPTCQIVKLFLQESGVAFEERNISENPSAKKEFLDGYRLSSTPAVIVGEQIITGFDLPRLKEVLRIN